jgi:hypothetical protein
MCECCEIGKLVREGWIAIDQRLGGGRASTVIGRGGVCKGVIESKLEGRLGGHLIISVVEIIAWGDEGFRIIGQIRILLVLSGCATIRGDGGTMG